MNRLDVAYSLIALMTIAIVALVGWRMYHSRERTMRRRQANELSAYRDVMAAKESER